MDSDIAQAHVTAAVAVASVGVALACVRFVLSCRQSRTGADTEDPRPCSLRMVLRPWLWLLALSVAVLVVTAAIVSGLDDLTEAIKTVVGYPNAVVADLRAMPASTIPECAAFVNEARTKAEEYEVPDFTELDDYTHYAWYPSLAWAVIVGVYVSSHLWLHFCGRAGGRSEVPAMSCTALGRTCCTCSALISALFWAATIVLSVALIVVRGGVAVGCDQAEVPDEAKFLFYASKDNSHPFLDTLVDNLIACNVTPAVRQHLDPGALEGELGVLHTVCDSIEDELTALVVLIFAALLAVVAGACVSRPETV